MHLGLFPFSELFENYYIEIFVIHDTRSKTPNPALTKSLCGALRPSLSLSAVISIRRALLRHALIRRALLLALAIIFIRRALLSLFLRRPSSTIFVRRGALMGTNSWFPSVRLVLRRGERPRSSFNL
uniref:Uncharacterized protein n=1 Tax=Cucumis melo TaxID=3656 RepID=A0A9I9EDX6_CUCME